MTDTAPQGEGQAAIDPKKKIVVTGRIYGPGPSPHANIVLAVPGNIVTAAQMQTWAEGGAFTQDEIDAGAEAAAEATEAAVDLTDEAGKKAAAEAAAKAEAEAKAKAEAAAAKKAAASKTS